MAYRILDELTNDLKDESTLGYIGRTGARTLARAGESVLGLPGDIVSGVKGLVNYGVNKLTGLEGPIGDIPLPTSEDIRERVTKPLTGEYLEPQGSGEEFYDRIISDAATLLIPLKTKVPFAKAIGGALGKSVVGNTAQWAAEKVTDSPLVGAGVKIGAMALAGTIGGRKELNNIKTQSYKDAFSKIPEKAKFDFKPETQKLEKIAKHLTKGDRPDKSFMLDRLRAADNILEGGKAGIEDAINLKQDWNKYLSDPSLSKNSRDTLKQAVGIVNDGIKRYGSTNPSFFKPYQIAEELTGALQSSNYIQKVLVKHPYLKDTVSNPIIQKLLWFGGISAGHSLSVPSAIGIGATALGAREGAKFYQLISKSPVARKYYTGVINASLRNDVKAIAKNLSKLDKAANDFDFDKEESVQGRYRIID